MDFSRCVECICKPVVSLIGFERGWMLVINISNSLKEKFLSLKQERMVQLIR